VVEALADYTAEAVYFPTDDAPGIMRTGITQERARFDHLEDAQEEARQYIAAHERTKVFIYSWPYGQRKLHSVIK